MNKKLDQQGAIAIISVVIFATIITVLITAYLRSAVSQQAQSLSYDFSTRAFYAAESGVQDTVRALKSDTSLVKNKDSCAPMTGSEADFGKPDFGASYSCQLIKVNPTTVTGSTSTNVEGALIKLQPQDLNAENTSLIVQWSTKIGDQNLYPRDGDTAQFPQTNRWFAGGRSGEPVHDLLRVEVVDHPNTSFSRDDITQRVAFLNPTKDTDADPSVDFSKSTPRDIKKEQKELFTNANCQTTEDREYACKQTIDLGGYKFTDRSVYVRITSVYRNDTKFSVQLADTASALLPLTNTQVEIDVTAKAGDDTYRRIRQTVSLGGYKTQDLDGGSASAVTVGEGICKNFVISNDPNTFNSGCTP